MTEDEILIYLVENNTKSFTIRDISINLNIAYKIVYEIVHRLNKENIITINKIGNSSQVQFNNVLSEKVFKVETLRKNQLLSNKNLKVLNNNLNDINNPFFIALIFGSYAKKTNSIKSDIDLCIICNDESIIKKIESKIQLLPLDIDLNIFSVEEFESMLLTKKFNVGHEIVKSNIILQGIENYYKIIKNE